ncbi:hypothetical protein [Roseiflexus castenholzii]|uniref:hypothetical protein n=1 Tax=Roseiflexus castenholzii TaxID=120962 RepID=UPI003C7EA13A
MSSCHNEHASHTTDHSAHYTAMIRGYAQPSRQGPVCTRTLTVCYNRTVVTVGRLKQ